MPSVSHVFLWYSLINPGKISPLLIIATVCEKAEWDSWWIHITLRLKSFKIPIKTWDIVRELIRLL